MWVGSTHLKDESCRAPDNGCNLGMRRDDRVNDFEVNFERIAEGGDLSENASTLIFGKSIAELFKRLKQICMG